jgi:NADPH2:quinone reductase
VPAGLYSLTRVRAIRIDEFGGPEVLRLADIPAPEPGDDQVLIDVSRAGINFADTHARENSYLAAQQLPLVPGAEVAGTVARAAGGLEAGRRVVALLASGGYAEQAVAPVAATFPVPEGVEDGVALALVLQGLTAWHLYRTAAQLRAGETVVVHAAAGGVGTLAVQLAKPFGAGRVIASASSEDKRDLALSLGADAAVDTGAEELARALREANGGRRVDVVLEMAGGRVFDQSLDALAPFGRLVAYGMASREQREVSNARLLRGSTAVVGFWLAHCFADPEKMGPPLRDLFERAGRGELRPVIGETYPLSDAQRAHEDLQARRTSGKLLLDPAA